MTLVEMIALKPVQPPPPLQRPGWAVVRSMSSCWQAKPNAQLTTYTATEATVETPAHIWGGCWPPSVTRVLSSQTGEASERCEAQ